MVKMLVGYTENMVKGPPRWVKNLPKQWNYTLENFKVTIYIWVISAVFMIVGVTLLSPMSREVVGGVVLATGAGVFFTGLFNVIYEMKTKSSFIQTIANINPNIIAGVIVHESHEKVKDRTEAIKEYLKRGEMVRIITATADNYVKRGEGARVTLEEKVKYEACSVQILLYFPVYIHGPSSRVGQRRLAPQKLIEEHRLLMDDYEDLIKVDDENINIKFFTLPHHINFLMIGNERMFTAPILHNIEGRALPCYEIYPTGSRSVFYKFQWDFDTVFKRDEGERGVVLSFDAIKTLYSEGGYKFQEVQQRFFKSFGECEKLV